MTVAIASIMAASTNRHTTVQDMTLRRPYDAESRRLGFRLVRAARRVESDRPGPQRKIAGRSHVHRYVDLLLKHGSRKRELPFLNRNIRRFPVNVDPPKGLDFREVMDNDMFRWLSQGSIIVLESASAFALLEKSSSKDFPCCT